MIAAANSLQRMLDINGHLRHLVYTLFSRPHALNPACTGYDLEIVLTDCLSGREERCLLPDITTDAARAEAYLQLFADGLVTPVTARDVMEDLLGSL